MLFSAVLELVLTNSIGSDADCHGWRGGKSRCFGGLGVGCCGDGGGSGLGGIEGQPVPN